MKWFWVIRCAAIYKIVSQRQIRDSQDEDNVPHNNVRPIHIAATETTEQKKGCCS